MSEAVPEHRRLSTYVHKRRGYQHSCSEVLASKEHLLWNLDGRHLLRDDWESRAQDRSDHHDDYSGSATTPESRSSAGRESAGRELTKTSHVKRNVIRASLHAATALWLCLVRHVDKGCSESGGK